MYSLYRVRNQKLWDCVGLSVLFVKTNMLPYPIALMVLFAGLPFSRVEALANDYPRDVESTSQLANIAASWATSPGMSAEVSVGIQVSGSASSSPSSNDASSTSSGQTTAAASSTPFSWSSHASAMVTSPSVHTDASLLSTNTSTRTVTVLSSSALLLQSATANFYTAVNRSMQPVLPTLSATSASIIPFTGAGERIRPGCVGLVTWLLVTGGFVLFA